MRPKQVAPEPTGSGSGNGSDRPKLGDSDSDSAFTSISLPLQTRTHVFVHSHTHTHVPERPGKDPVKHYGLHAIPSDDDYDGDDINRCDYDYKDDMSQPSTDDPYTYSDDSASLSDAYFLRQPSPPPAVTLGTLGSFPLPFPGPGQLNADLYHGDDLAPWQRLPPERPRSVCDFHDIHDIHDFLEREMNSFDKNFQFPRKHEDLWPKLKPPTKRERTSRPKHPTRRELIEPPEPSKRKEKLSVLIQPPLPPYPGTSEEDLFNEHTSLLRNLNNNNNNNNNSNNRRPLSTLQNRRITSFANSEAHRRHRQKHELRKRQRLLLLQQQQQKQKQRERAVSEVRGTVQQPNNTRGRRDRFWSVAFLLQLLLVCFSAAKHGSTFYTSSSSVSSESSLSLASVRDRLSAMVPAAWRTSSSTQRTTKPSGSIDPAMGSSTLVVLELNDDDANAGSAKIFTSDNNNDRDDNDDDEAFIFTIDYKNVLSLLLISGMYACVTAYLSFALMLIMARSVIPMMLVFTMLLMLCWGVFGLFLDTDAGSIISVGGFTVFVLSSAYTLVHWDHVPFCSTNLFAAICAMRSSVGLLVMGISSLFVGLLWLLIWTMALTGVFNRNNYVDCEIRGDCETHVYISRDDRVVEVGLLIVSLYWTTMVIKNVVQVAVAGVIGGPWWFGVFEATETDNELDLDLDDDDPVAEQQTRLHEVKYYRGGCRSNSMVSYPLIRACTISFGTICFGSLVELPAQILSIVVSCLCWITDDLVTGDSGPAFGENPRVPTPFSDSGSEGNRSGDEEEKYLLGGGNRDETELLGRTPTTTNKSELVGIDDRKHSPGGGGSGGFPSYLHRLDRVLRSCNRWAYVYIGMYNYSFCEGGEKAIQLFETREWMDIARDTLIQNILLMASTVIGGLTGMVSVVVEEVDGYEFTSLHKPIMTSFLIGFFLGFILSNILLLGLAGAAVNTILVCFAAEPFEFDRVHPNLSREMREVWSQQVWEPDEI